MPFILYKWERNGKGFRVFERLKQVKLAGYGPIASYVRQVQSGKAVTPLQWHATEGEILTQLGESECERALIIDLKPNVEGVVSLYHLREIWGFSYELWTPIALRLETLFAEGDVQDPAEFKQKFNDVKCTREQVHEFLYLQGGTQGGTWNWGPVGSVNGALLPPDALKYFLAVLTNSLRNHSTGE